MPREETDKETNLLACLDYLLLVIGFCDSLHSSQCFTTTSLLDPNMDEPVLYSLVITSIRIKKRVCQDNDC